MADLRIGTSAFTAAGWETAFYPAGMKPADYLTHYATKFNTVEVDSTFYRTPSVATVNGWERKTPTGFSLAAKVPQVITHEKILKACDEDLQRFLETMDLMGDELGPLLFQFGYFNKTAFKSGTEFLARLEPFLIKLPERYRFALEIRNKQWLSAEFFELLRAHKVAYALIDQAWMPRVTEIFEKFDPAGSTGQCNTIQCPDSAMLPRENYLFGRTRPKPSQGGVHVGRTLATDFGFRFQCKVGSSLVLRRSIETTAVTGQMDFHGVRREVGMGREPDKAYGLPGFFPILNTTCVDVGRLHRGYAGKLLLLTNCKQIRTIRGGGELNFFRLLIGRKLLVLRSARNAKIAQNA